MLTVFRNVIEVTETKNRKNASSKNNCLQEKAIYWTNGMEIANWSEIPLEKDKALHEYDSIASNQILSNKPRTSKVYQHN